MTHCHPYAFWHFGVPDSPELQRIKALPRRVLDLNTVPDLTPIFRVPGGTLKLWKIQSAALWEAAEYGGCFVSIPPGSGKALITLLMPQALGAERPLILVEAKLRDKLLEKDIPFWSKHFRIKSEKLRIFSYNDLSSPKKYALLEELNPDAIISDEAHAFRSPKSVRTKRFRSFMRKHPKTKFVPLTGSPTSKSLLDYEHLSHWALGDRSPVPHEYNVLKDWSEALDVSEYPRPAGALLQLCEGIENDSGRVGVSRVRSAYRRRFIDSPGVVSSAESEVNTPLILKSLRPQLPTELVAALVDFRATWSIGADEISDSIGFFRVANQLASGFYYEWQWPNGIKDWDWLSARAAYKAEEREYLSHHNTPGMDSPALLALANISGRWKAKSWPAWDAVRKRKAPPIKPVWISDFLVRAALIWAVNQGTGIIWYTHDVVGKSIAEKGNYPLFGEGSGKAILTCTAPIIVCSVRAIGTGNDLQDRWSSNLFTSMLNGKDFQQCIARTRRYGQTAERVTCDIYLHTQEVLKSWNLANLQAEYVEETTGIKQHILHCEKTEL